MSQSPITMNRNI